MFRQQNDIKLLQQFANSIISFDAPGVDFTKTNLTIETDYGTVTWYANNNIQLQQKNDPAIFSLQYLNKCSILEDGFKECMKNHLWGNYIHIDGQDIQWNVMTGNFFLMVAYTDFGRFDYEYDFDFSFDSNLEAFVEKLTEYMAENTEEPCNI